MFQTVGCQGECKTRCRLGGTVPLVINVTEKCYGKMFTIC